MCLFCGAKAHYSFYTGTVVPTSVEDDDLTGSRKMRDVALDIHLRMLSLGRGG